TIAILISMVISLTITPCMCAYLLRGRQDLHSRARWAVWAETLFNRFQQGYAQSLRAVLRHRALTGAVMVALIAGNVFLFKLLPPPFAPEQDSGIVVPDHRRPGDLLSGDVPEARRAAGHRAEGSGGRLRVRLCRRRLGRPRRQHGQRVHRPEA